MIVSRVATASLFVLAAVASPAPGRCATPAANFVDSVPVSAQSAYGDGKFLLAATIAEADGSAAALVFATRARIADAITRDDGLCLDCLVRAEATAQAAIAAGSSAEGGNDSLAHRPALAEGYVQLAIAIGFHGRLLDAFEAQSEGLAEKGRAAIDRALELDPSNAWARASLGGWHLEIVQRAGPVLAATLYGAHEDEGLKNFRASLAEDPGNLLLHYHYALSILALDEEDFRAEATQTLEAGLKDSRNDAMSAFTRKRAFELLEHLKTGNTGDIETLVRRLQGYPQ